MKQYFVSRLRTSINRCRPIDVLVCRSYDCSIEMDKTSLAFWLLEQLRFYLECRDITDDRDQIQDGLRLAFSDKEHSDVVV